MAWILEKPRPAQADQNPFPELHLFPRSERVVRTAGCVLKTLVHKLPLHPIQHAEGRVRGAEEFLSECFASDDSEALEPRE